MEKDLKFLPFETKKDKKWFIGLLKDGPVTISFVKKDGSERKMTCTLAESKIPEEKLPKNTGKVKSDDAQPVFDLEKQEWRSFRWDSMTGFKFYLGE
jgi:hypothetical protein